MMVEPDAEPTLAAATEVQRLDVAAMHEKALGILATLNASGVAKVRPRTVTVFYTAAGVACLAVLLYYTYCIVLSY